MTTFDPYAVLGVDPGAARDDIRRAWLAAARRHHPDRGGDAAAMQAVNEAWAVLGDPARRRAWDREHGVGPLVAEPAAEPDQPPPDDADDWLDARPLAPPVRSPFTVVPAGMFGVSVLLGCLAVALDVTALLAVAGFAFFLSCLAVLAAAMLSMRRSVRSGYR